MLKVVLLALSATCLASAEEVAKADFYVAPDGSDDGPGTASAPFRTVTKARDEARKKIAAGLKEDLLILLRDGTYELSEPLLFGPGDSNSGGHRVTYAAYPGEKPVLSGGRRIEGWKRGEGQIWTAEVPLVKEGKWIFRQLFVGGQRRTRARTPSEGFFRIDGPSSQESPFHLKFRGQDMKKSWAETGDVEVVAMLAWAEIRMQVRSVDEAQRIAILSGNPRPSNRENDARYYVENAPDGLDSPGEWRLDARSGTVSYWPVPGEDMTQVEVIAPALPELVRLEGDPAADRFVRSLSFDGLTFSHTDWTLGESGYADTQASVAIGGALEATGAIGCSVERCAFTKLAGYAVEFGKGCKRNRIVGNEIFDIGAGGVRIGETAQRQSEAEQTFENVVTDNHLHHLGLVYHAAVGIWVGQSSRNTLAHNEIHDLFYTAISVGWTWGYGPNQCKGNVVEQNHLHHLGKDMLSDMGGIYTLGVQPGTILRNNLIHDVSAFTYGGWGIYPDEGSSDILIENNVVYGCKSANFHQHYGRENVVRNNIFAFGRESQLMRTRTEEHVSFMMERNIVYWKDGALLGSNWNDNNYRMDGNLYWKVGGGEVRFARWSLEEWKAKGQDVHSSIEDPLFADPENRDFSLKPESPALKMGFKPIDVSKVGPRPEFRRS